MSQAEADRLLAIFLDSGAQRVEADILQPADTLLDLYGEDIRGRAYVTHDPLRGEMMLRPDFTVPVVQRHMAERAEPAQYTYAGPVFRAQEDDTGRPTEYMQVGFEVFDRAAPAGVEARVFALFHSILTPLGCTASLGDIGLVLAAIDGLSTTDARKAALKRHVWRPHRFADLLGRFSQPLKLPSKPLGGPHIGVRSGRDVAARHAMLEEEAKLPPLAAGEVEVFDRLLAINGAVPDALDELGLIANDFPALGAAVGKLSDRVAAIEAAGVDIARLKFAAAFGLTSMEYYDGFVFGFAQPNGDTVASGGRYDALTRVLGQGQDAPAVGGVIRPELTAALVAALAGDAA